MKKHILSLLGALPAFAFSQTFTDNFESYTAGSKLAGSSAVWATWTGAGGGADDVNVVNTKAHGGNNSVFFSSTVAAGGPADVVLPFGGQYNTGTFELSMWLFVETSKSAYFNFQEQSAVGKAWAMDVNLTSAGDLTVSNTVSGSLLATTYSQNVWTQFVIKIDLNTNTWEILLDGVSKGKFQNGYRQIASMDIYPTNGSAFYIDDVAYTYTAYTPTTTNAGVTFIGNVAGFLAGSVLVPTVEIRNLGNTAIASAEIELVYDGITQTKTVSGLSLAYKALNTVTMADPIVIKPGKSQVVARVVKVNGNADDNAGDNEKTLDLDPIVPADGKVVVGEEATGTWCGWCPRGAVMMANLDKKYPGFFIGIAVHNSDPMTYYNYDRGMANYVSSYPSAIVDRGVKIDPSAMETDFLKRILVAPKAVMVAGADFNTGTRTLKVSVTTKFKTNITGNYRIACVLIEDGVKGSTSGYNQSNYYSGGGSGVMGGYEILGNPVPASQMVYDHVARTISPGFGGVPNAYGSSKNAGDSAVHNFTFEIPAEWNTDKMHIAGLFIDPTGKIDNGAMATISEAQEHGYISGQEVLETQRFAAPDAALRIFPNPSQSVFVVEANNTDNAEFTVTDITGKTVLAGKLSGKLLIHAEDWKAGTYMFRMTTSSGIQSQKLIKN